MAPSQGCRPTRRPHPHRVTAPLTLRPTGEVRDRGRCRQAHDTLTCAMTDRQPSRAIDTRIARNDRKIDRERHRKLRQLRLAGCEPFPVIRLPRRLLTAEVCALHDPRQLTPGEHSCWRYTVAGRLVGRRKHRHAMFLDLRDESGTIELCVRPGMFGGVECVQLRGADMGDIVCAEGTVYVTDNHELTLSVTCSRLLAKALRSPPARHPEAMSGDRRALDLLANERTRGIFKARSTITQAMRGWMSSHGFVEVEGPVLQPAADGTDARSLAAAPSEHPNWTATLRSSSRSYLRRCLLGGLEKVYELGSCFTADRRSRVQAHELTMLEWAAAYCDYTEAAGQAEQLILHAAASIAPQLRVRWRDSSVDLHGPWRTMTVREGIEERCGLDVLTADTCVLARQSRARAGAEDDSWGAMVNALYEDLVEPTLIQPTVVYDFPLAGQELVRRHPSDDRLASSFRVVIGGIEVARGVGELNDPHEQWERIAAQPGSAADGGRGTPAPTDRELLLLEYGLCPAASARLHVDRLLMLLSESSSVHEVIPFPLRH